LAEKYKLTINTSADLASTNDCLQHNNIDLFTSVYAVEISKDKVKKFQKILSDFKVEVNECVFITDTVGDVKEASKLSVPTILVSWGYHDKSHFAELKEDVISIVDKPLDLLDLLS